MLKSPTVPIGAKRPHANGWITTVLQRAPRRYEGYLWNRGGSPLKCLRDGLDLDAVQAALDLIAEDFWHVCTVECADWADHLAPSLR